MTVTTATVKPHIICNTVFQNESKDKCILRAAIYSRVSTCAEIQEGSFETQNEYFRRKIENDPAMELAGIYGDFGKTGRNTDQRAEFQKLVQDCKDGKIDIIFTKNISRFARNFLDCMETLKLLKSLHVRVIFEENGIDTSDIKSELLLSILAAVAEEESNSIGANLQWSHDRCAEKGMPMTVPPYAFKRKRKSSVWTIDEGKAKHVQFAFQWADEGISISEIVRKLNRQEIEESTGKVWTRDSVRYMLSNINYQGDFITGRRIKLGRKQRWNNGERDQYYLENHHPAIVSRELFERVQKRLEQNKQRRKAA